MGLAEQDCPKQDPSKTASVLFLRHVGLAEVLLLHACSSNSVLLILKKHCIEYVVRVLVQWKHGTRTLVSTFLLPRCRQTDIDRPSTEARVLVHDYMHVCQENHVLKVKAIQE